MGVKYRVLDIDQNTQILHITRDDFFNDLLCSPTYLNTTFDSDQFEYAPDFEGVTLYYDCPPAVHGMAGYFNCTHQSTHKNGIIGNEPQTMGCNSSLRVGMRRSYFGVIWDLPKLAEALKEGFGLKYKVDTWLCSNCTKSGGACGYDISSKQPTCYCADGSSGQRPCPLRKDVELGTDLGLLGVTTEEGKEIAVKMVLGMANKVEGRFNVRSRFSSEKSTSFFHPNHNYVKMNSRPPSSSFPLLLLSFCLLLVTIKFPPCWSLEYWFRDCRNRFDCGNITGVDYPFWGVGRPEDCGYPHLHLQCNESQSMIEIMDVKYEVLGIDQNTQVLQITRDDFSNNLLCSPKYPNTTFDLNQFEYAPDFAEITMYYDCPPALQGNMTGHFNCAEKSTYKNGFIGIEPQNNMGCNSSLKVGIRRSYFGDIGDLPKMREALIDGFGLKYKVDTGLCSNCTKSGGACGYDLDSRQPTCYCEGGSSGQGPCSPPSPPTAQKKGINPAGLVSF
ncbi:hypothetical protein FEM48_Zijuj04G0186500 [Ziziphus jujuba var. spinosa]|uniref:non-specific serine/threonine protein kinase n=1 Tax=Ziziphus jujuba var. spinosa TaxID=714518 RepID=A0A978VLI6_ZIZJJ|nr:hypothetical protein FEM48_Zijuj04G0186500 [Ziziphus jujuba var. spinosa]